MKKIKTINDEHLITAGLTMRATYFGDITNTGDISRLFGRQCLSRGKTLFGATRITSRNAEIVIILIDHNNNLCYSHIVESKHINTKNPNGSLEGLWKYRPTNIEKIKEYVFLIEDLELAQHTFTFLFTLENRVEKQAAKISKIKLPPVLKNHERAWYKCRQCSRIMYHDYVPYSLSNGIWTLPCGHGLGLSSIGDACDTIEESKAVALFKVQEFRKRK